jgi:hypothetical protein
MVIILLQVNELGVLRQLGTARRLEALAEALAAGSLTQEVLAGIDELITNSVRLQLLESVSCRHLSSRVRKVSQLANFLRSTAILLIISAAITNGKTHGLREHTESLSGLGARRHVFGEALTIVELSTHSLFGGCHFYL